MGVSKPRARLPAGILLLGAAGIGMLPYSVARSEEGTLEKRTADFILGLKFALAASSGVCRITWPVIQECHEQVVGRLKPWIEMEYAGFKKAELFDKFKHCTISCVMGFECGSGAVLPIGGLKELWDVVDGYVPESIRGTTYDGTPEWADFEADYKGLAASWAPAMRGVQDCPTACRSFYPISDSR